jgi:hypothetical protein
LKQGDGKNWRVHKSTKKDMVKFENYGLKVSVTTLLGCETFNPKTLAAIQKNKEMVTSFPCNNNSYSK